MHPETPMLTLSLVCNPTFSLHRHRHCRDRCPLWYDVLQWSKQRASTPAQLVQTPVGNTEVMRYFVDDGPGDNVDQLDLVSSDTADRRRKTVMRSGMAPP